MGEGGCPPLPAPPLPGAGRGGGGRAQEVDLDGLTGHGTHITKHPSSHHTAAQPTTCRPPTAGSLHYVASPDPETERALWHQAQQFFTDTFVEQVG